MRLTFRYLIRVIVGELDCKLRAGNMAGMVIEGRRSQRELSALAFLYMCAGDPKHRWSLSESVRLEQV